MSKIERLNDYQHARIRTEMYLSSRDPHTQTIVTYENGKPTLVETTWVPAVFTAFREVLDNALDEVITHRSGDKIDVTYDPKTMTFSVCDNGRGIPIEFSKEHGMHLATMALSETKAGRNFGDRGASRGLNGVGASVVNFVSEWFEVDITRDKKSFNQRFNEGEGNLLIEDPIIMPAKRGAQTGTRVSFKLSKSVFSDLRLPLAFVEDRIYEAALSYPDLKLTFNGEPVRIKSVDKTLFPDHKPIFFEIDREGFKSRFWLVPAFFEGGSEHAHSVVNAIPVFNGGVHIEAFKKHFFAGVIEALSRESKKRKLTPNRSDLADGMLVYNITEMEEPSFDSQSKTRLINENVAAIVRSEMDDPEFFKRVVKANPDWVEAIYARCAARTMKKDASEAAKLAKKNLRLKVKELEDAAGRDRTKCILALAEGVSASSGITEARDPDIHGSLPLRGKVLNVYGQSPKTVLANEALSKIMSAIGLVPGEKADRLKLRYGSVWLCMDADQDGANIAALMINFFFQMWPELFDPDEKPFVYVLNTPLIIAAKGKERKYWYSDNVDSFDADKVKGYSVTRAKGLAALVREDWRNILAAPKLQPIIDDGSLSAALELLFSPDADARKEWIGI